MILIASEKGTVRNLRRVLPLHRHNLHSPPCICAACIRDKQTTLTQVPKPTVTLEAAMKLYGLTSFELLWEQERDTKALLAWSDDTVVLAFRGTASLRNVIADIQVRRCTLCAMCVYAHQTCACRRSPALSSFTLAPALEC